MDAILIYMTCATEAEAKDIVSALLEQELIACGNIMAPHVALYRWQGKMEEGREVAVLMKSRAPLFPRIEAEVKARHSYECPCLLALPVAAGHEPFLQWLANSVKADP